MPSALSISPDGADNGRKRARPILFIFAVVDVSGQKELPAGTPEHFFNPGIVHGFPVSCGKMVTRTVKMGGHQDAVMIEPTTIAIQSCTRAELEKDDMLLIYGAGALGSSILKIAHTICDHIIVADIMDDKLSEAREHGAQFTINAATEDFQAKVLEYTHGRGATVSIDAACVKNSLLLLLQATGNAGRVITMGFSTAPTEVNQFLITSKELDVRGSRLQNKMFGKAIDMIKEGTLDLNNSISHTFPLTKAQEAFDFVDSRDPSIRKIVFTFDF